MLFAVWLLGIYNFSLLVRTATGQYMCHQKINDIPHVDISFPRMSNQADNIILYAYPL